MVTRGSKSVKVLLGGDQLVVLGPNSSKIYSQSTILLSESRKKSKPTGGAFSVVFGRRSEDVLTK